MALLLSLAVEIGGCGDGGKGGSSDAIVGSLVILGLGLGSELSSEDNILRRRRIGVSLSHTFILTFPTVISFHHSNGVVD